MGCLDQYFDDKLKAEEYVKYCWSGDYTLSSGEACHPTYKIVKVPNKKFWRVRITRHYFGPKDYSCWLSKQEYQLYLDFLDEPETRPENALGGTFRQLDFTYNHKEV